MWQPESFAKGVCEQCGGRIEFPSESAGQTIDCPHCKWPTLLTAIKVAPMGAVGGPPVRKRLYPLLATAAFVLLAGSAAYLRFKLLPVVTAQPAGSRPVASAPVSPPKPKPALDPWHGLKPSPVTLDKAVGGGLVYAIGTVTNDSTRQRFGVKVELDVLDEHRNKLGTATDYTDVIEPGKEWKYRAMVTAKTAVSLKLVKVKEQE
jgi:hypothetical protein